jgi:hypothetical protein
VSNDVTPMPTPLYRGEQEMNSHLLHPHGHMIHSSPLASASPSPSAISMQRLLLSPTNTHAMSPLPPTSSSHATKHGSSSLLQSQRLVTPSKPRSFSTSPHSSSSLASHSPPPLDTTANTHTAYAHSISSNIASLTALSQAAMRSPSGRDSPMVGPHSITISLQNHTPAGSMLSQQTASSLASSAVSSPNDARAGSNASSTSATSHLPSTVTGTPKATSTSLYSNLLLNGVMLTPRLLPRATHTTASTPMSATSSLMQKSTSQPMQLSLAVGAVDTTLATSDLSDDSREADESNRHQSTMGVLPSFALFFAIGQLPSVQKEVTAVLSAQDGAKNREKLQRIEAIFAQAAEKVNNEELSLQI